MVRTAKSHITRSAIGKLNRNQRLLFQEAIDQQRDLYNPCLLALEYAWPGKLRTAGSTEFAIFSRYLPSLPISSTDSEHLTSCMTGEEQQLLEQYLTHLNVLGEEGTHPDFEAWYQEVS